MRRLSALGREGNTITAVNTKRGLNSASSSHSQKDQVALSGPKRQGRRSQTHLVGHQVEDDLGVKLGDVFEVEPDLISVLTQVIVPKPHVALVVTKTSASVSICNN